MPGPWEAFQDSAAGDLSRNDQNIAAPARAPVQSSPRVWGDDEAKRAGLYESPAGPWSAFRQSPPPQSMRPDPTPPGVPARAPLRITVNKVNDRFGAMQPPESGVGEMQRGLDQRGLELTRGPEASPAAQMAISHENALSAASQGTTPDVSQYGGKLISTQAFEDDGGNIHYLDPETKKLKPVNASTQVAIRDPADNTVKVFDRSDATNESPLTGAARVATQGLGAGAPTARAALSSAANVIPKASDTFSTAKPFYREFTKEASKIGVPEETAAGIGERLRRALDAKGLDAEMAGAPAKAAIGRLESPNEPMTLDYLQRIKRVAGRGFNSPDKNVRDGASILSGEISKVIAEVSPEASQGLKTADQIHSTAMAQQKLQRSADIADLRTGRAGYGGNAVNAMRQVLSPIVQKSIEGRVTGFQPGEIRAMREIVEGTTGTNAMRQIGAMSPSKGIMQIAVGGATGGLTAALGAGANKLAAVMTGKQIERLNQLVAQRSPAYAQAVEKAISRFEQAQIDLGNNPAPNKLAALVAASRALSSGLSRDGIPISSGDLLKSIQGPMRSAADEDQPAVPGRPGE